MVIHVRKYWEIDQAFKFIEKVKEYNDFSFIDNLELVLDYSLDEAGYYLFSNLDRKNLKKKIKLFVNPDCCMKTILTGYSEDDSLVAAIVHEFCHFLDNKLKISQRYEKTFDTNLHLNIYSKENLLEELAEVMYLYITNPYLLKHISKERYEFLATFFVSPTECSARKFVSIWKKWPRQVKKKCRLKWGITASNNSVKILHGFKE